MPWTFHVEKGILYNPAGSVMAWGYSGTGIYRNNPEAQALHNLGPIPRGKWTMQKAIDHTELGPIAIPLEPDPDTNTFGRADFFIHGDNPAHRGQSSHGCPVFPRFAREQMDESPDRTFQAV